MFHKYFSGFIRLFSKTLENNRIFPDRLDFSSHANNATRKCLSAKGLSDCQALFSSAPENNGSGESCVGLV